MIKITTGTKNVAFHERKSEPKPNIFHDIPTNRNQYFKHKVYLGIFSASNIYIESIIFLQMRVIFYSNYYLPIYTYVKW